MDRSVYSSINNSNNNKSNSLKMNQAFEKVRAAILSCTEKDHTKGSRRLVKNFNIMYENAELYEILKRFYNLKMGDFVWF